MSLTRWQRTIVNEAGDVIDGAEVEVFKAGTTDKPDLFQDSDGNDVQTNPFNADSNGFAAFYVDGGLYDIAVNDVTLWTDVALGDVRGRNVGSGPNDVPDNSVLALRERIERDATLLLDFENNRYRIYEGLADGNTEKPYADIVTHTRASDATGFNALGTLSTVTSDTQRLVYSPETGRSEGLLVEEERTNSLLDNRDLRTGNWSVDADLSILQDKTGLDGVANKAWTVTKDTEGSYSPVSQSVTIPDDGNPVSIVWFIGKQDNASTGPQFEGALVGGTKVNLSFGFDPSTGDAGAISGSGTSNLTVLNSGDFWKVVLTLTNNGTGNTTFLYRFDPARVKTSDLTTIDDTITGSIIYDYGQVELNTSTASSPIETGGTAVTRAADVVSQDEAGKWFNAESWTLLVDLREVSTDASNFGVVVHMGVDSTERVSFGIYDTGQVVLFVRDETGTVLIEESVPFYPGVYAAIFGSDGVPKLVRGADVYTGSAGLPIQATQFGIGNSLGNGQDPTSFTSRHIKFVPYELDVTEAQIITQPEET